MIVTKWYAFYALAPVIAMLLVSLWPKHKWIYSFSKRSRVCAKCGEFEAKRHLNHGWMVIKQGDASKHRRNKYRIVGVKK